MRVVFDTNVLLSALLFKGGALSYLRKAWGKDVMQVLVSKDTVSELIRVLAYPKFKLSHADIDLLLADYLPYTITVNVDNSISMSLCRDRHDQMFIALATCGKADVLVTGDKDLLIMQQETVFAVESPAIFKKSVQSIIQC